MPSHSRFHLPENHLETIKILKAAGLYDIIYNTNTINENIDWKFIRMEGQELGNQIAFLIKKIVKSQSKKAYRQMKHLVIQCQKYIKENKQPITKRFIKQALLSLLWGLAFILVDIGAEGSFNDPILSKYHFHEENGMLVGTYEGEEKQATVDKEGNPQIDVDSAIQQQFPQVQEKLNQSPVVLLNDGESVPEYHASEQMKKIIAQRFEGFSDHIYDAKVGRGSRVSQQEMSILSKDLTIGYGHKLTAKERKTWKANKTISKEEAYQLFLVDFQEHENSALRGLQTLPYYSEVKFSQGFIDGLISIRYNSGTKLVFGHPSYIQGESFWERMKNCRIDTKNHCLNKQDFEFALSKVKTLYKPNPDTEAGLKRRRLVEYNIMRQSFGDINPNLYKF